MKTESKLRYSALAATAVSAALAFLAPVANASPVIAVNCPGTVNITNDREFTLGTATATTCLAYGTGNINGNPGTDDFLDTHPSYKLLDKSDQVGDLFEGKLTITGAGGSSGTFSIGPVAGYSSFALGIKSGKGDVNDLKWAVFGLNGNLSGSWGITFKAQALSHMNLYGIKSTTPVPVPAAVWLLGSALVSVGAASRQKSEAV